MDSQYTPIIVGSEVLNGSRRVVDVFRAESRLVIVTAPSDGEGLSERQLDVCRLAAAGHADKWIGYELGIARSTVATHLAAALSRLGLKARTELAFAWPLLEGTGDVRVIDVHVGGEVLTALLGPATRPEFDCLTEAEHEVMFHAVRGASNAEIARTRGTSTRTVANQLASIYRKLGLASRTELAALVA